MKRNVILTAFISIVLFSCSGGFSKGVKKDLSTGLSASYNGFTLEDIYLANAAGKRLNSNNISLGDKIVIEATGVNYFSEKDGKVFPGCLILLTDRNNKEILNLPDAFAGMTDGTTAAEAKVLQASLNTGEPMLVGETYHLKINFYDKLKKENEIKADVDLNINK